jgi:Skp family chaperone for outer membrane proteins
MFCFFKKFIFILTIFLTFHSNLNSDVPYFVDFKYILNESKAGKEAQIYLKKKLTNGIKQLKDKEKAIQKAEKKIIEQKKLLAAEEYKKKVNDLRNQVASLQKERDNLLDSVAKQRTKARSELLKNLNPIIQDYMKEKKIRMVIDKKSILLADENLDLTKEIIKLLNKKLKSIKLN